MPDLNSVPPSPLVLALSRRPSSQQMPPPPVPSSPSLNILPSNQSAVSNGAFAAAPPLPSPHLQPGPAALPTMQPPQAESGVGPGPGPLRHPQPLTAADLHMQMEKEQEARVNRLSRELSHLRAQHNASVASNASSTSASASGTEQLDTHLMSGPGYAIPSSRHHRSPSNTSTRSQTAAILGTSIESRSNVRPSNPTSLSRQNSTASRRSRTSSPAPQHLPLGSDSTFSYFQHQRIPTSVPSSAMVATPGSAGISDQLSPGLVPATPRYEETAFYRAELEAAKRENDNLKRRIRELERMLRDRRTSDASRTRSESVSTTASANVPGTSTGGAVIAGPREGGRSLERERGMTILSAAGSVGVGVPEEELRVGESAASAGTGALDGQGS